MNKASPSQVVTARKMGGHVSAAGGLDKAIERAAAIGANCVQVFSGSPRVWARAPLDKIPVEKIAAKQQELSITPIITHALYLTNLASDNPNLVLKSIKALTYDLQFDSLVKGSGVVVHLGSHQGRGWAAVRTQVADAITTVLEHSPQNSTLLIENSAGQNGKLCSKLEEIRWLLDTVKSARLGWCFDTCHGWAAGYKLGAGQSGDHSTTIQTEITKFNLWGSLKCIHVNDSRDPFASGRDRHANLGDGIIPSAELREFLHTPQLMSQPSVPLILEVPGIDDQGPDAENIKRLRQLAV